MHWNGYDGRVVGIRGALGWDGATRLQCVQDARIADEIPDQNTDDTLRSGL